ncbi:hypothetical protein MBLNU457_g2388t1 [Dothideomycetes sp. NU457]
MRPLRLLLAFTSCLFTIILLSYLATSRSSQASRVKHHDGNSRSLFNWHSPSSLFPPSAIISLTDDNSTFFLARPASFGPLLPSHGFSGQLWIGSGFGDDNLGRGGVNRAEGELGCSDVPGWAEGGYRGETRSRGHTGDKYQTSGSTFPAAEKDPAHVKRGDFSYEAQDDEDQEDVAAADDGTDDHLHRNPNTPIDLTPLLKKKPGHADIQSIQESAEISGKIVLLTRGGCGFLEKVKWAQRRGATAVIVGDNVRGGALVTMYGRGDTSNVSIPAVFTSHTTAHLLSSLIPPDARYGDMSLGDVARFSTTLEDKSISSAGQDGSSKKSNKPALKNGRKDNVVNGPKKVSVPKAQSRVGPFNTAKTKDSDGHWKDASWMSSFFGSRTVPPKKASRRPPNSGNLDWVLMEDFSVGEEANVRTTASKSTATVTPTAKPRSKAKHDGFIIGVHDWRDPDLVEKNVYKDDTTVKDVSPHSNKDKEQAGPKGGIITPSSGQYNADRVVTRKPKIEDESPKSKDDDSSDSWFGILSWKDKHADAANAEAVRILEETPVSGIKIRPSKHDRDDSDDEPDQPIMHQGLWVTLQLTSMSSSPFLDTLLVLVVSPLVTLTVVYALLLIRSRIRRRRWRAPKSVVDKLPVRTYQTIASTTGSSTSSSPPDSPTSANFPTSPTMTTPLLQSGARPIRQRPRSRTAGDVVASSSSLGQSASLDQVQEKNEAGLAEWRRKYGGRQRECVVCLEEYVDGVSRVMSLPCGHEFHAECITPWLTTRRRTCPICKGDVVRSLAKAPASSLTTTTNAAHNDLYDDEVDDHDHLIDGVQEQAVATRNDDPAAAEPIRSTDEGYEDLEQGVVPDRNR